MEGGVSRYTCSLIFCIIAAGLCPDILMPKAHGLAESAGLDGSNAQAVHELGETGQDVNVGLVSADNARTTHEAFYDKDSNGLPIGQTHAYSYDFTGYGVNITGHDTWVAGVVASRGGAFYPNDIGVAPGVDIHSARVADDNDVVFPAWLKDALEELITAQNCRVIVTGISLVAEPDGQSDWTLLYDYYAYEHNVVFALAAGNFGSEIHVFGDAYNGITTGGLVVTDPNVYLQVGNGSNSGPTSDDRRKPEIVAPSQNQTMPSSGSDSSWHTWTSDQGETSLSVPHTAGAAALLLGLADETVELDDGHNEVIKAVIVNSTFPNINDKAGGWTNPADPNNTWHPDRGYGRIDALRAYQTLAAERIYKDTTISADRGWAYATMTSNYEQHSYFIVGSRNHRLVFTVTWNRRVNKIGQTYTEEAPPKFNLDLTITGPNGQTLFTETDTLNNMEKVDLVLPGDGTYEISLANTTKKDRSYGLAFELRPPIIGDFAPLDYIVDYADMDTIAQEWLLEGPDLEADLISDGIINLPDFAEFANHWLETDSAYYQP